MASDSFTNTNMTPIGSHTAGGNTWIRMASAEPLGFVVGNQLGWGEGVGVSCRASNSSSDFCQVLVKGGAYIAGTKCIHVRAGDSNRGYELQIGGITGDTITEIYLKKDEAVLTWVEGLSLSRLVDHTLAIKAVASGGDVRLYGYIDGVQITWLHQDSNVEAPSLYFTDLAANTPLVGGNPGISVLFEDGMTDAVSRMDDWTDTESGGGGAPPIKERGADGGFVDLSGGLE